MQMLFYSVLAQEEMHELIRIEIYWYLLQMI